MMDDDEVTRGPGPNQANTHTEVTPFLSDQHQEEERLRSDIYRYLVNKSSGVFHYSVELRTITLDIIGISHKASQEEFRETENCLLDLLYSDPQRRFSIVGERDHIFVKRAPLDEDQINKLVEEWRCLIASFLFESKRIVCLSDIGSSVRRPISIPSSVKLIYIIKSDPLNRFVLQGEGNVAKVRFNMQTDPDQESLWVAKWRDDIASFLTKQQWSSPSLGIDGIESHIMRPFFLHPGVLLLDILAADPFKRFVIMGFGAEARVTIRTFRGDEPEIEKYVEHWRKLITNYLLSKNDVLGASHLPIGLSKIGAYVARPIGVPASVKLIDVMRTDPLNRFTVNGDGNALRVTINSESQLAGTSVLTDQDGVAIPQPEQKVAGHIVLSNRLAAKSNSKILENVLQHQRERAMEFSSSSSTNTHELSGVPFPQQQQQQQQQRGSITSRPPPGLSNHIGSIMAGNNLDYNIVGAGSVGRLSSHSPDSNLYDRNVFRDQNYSSVPYLEYQDTQSNQTHHLFDQQRIRQEHLLQVQQFHQRNFPTLPSPQQIQLHGAEHVKSNHNQKTNSSANNRFGMGPDPRLGGPERDRQHLGTDVISQNTRRKSSTQRGSIDHSEYDCVGSVHSEYDELSRGQGQPMAMDGTGFQPVMGYSHDALQRNQSMRGLHLAPPDPGTGYESNDQESSTQLLSYSETMISSSHNQALSLGRGLGSLFSDSFGSPSDSSISPLPSPATFLTVANLSMKAPEEDVSLSYIPPHKWMIKAWLPMAFEGFDRNVIDYFIRKLRDDGGFVTLQDLLDARASNELTREVLADIAGFKLGHYNRLERALAAAERESCAGKG